MEHSPHVYLSYAQADESDAIAFRKLMESLNVPVDSCRDGETGENVLATARSVLSNCSVIVVLIGERTRDSRWVDMEISLAMEPREDQPGAGLLGIILKSHPDFAKPYYEPDSIPLRLHDRVRWEYGMVRKWTDDPQQVRTWLDDANRRRHHFRSATNITTMRALHAFSWDDSVDTPRPILKSLLEQEP